MKNTRNLKRSVWHRSRFPRPLPLAAAATVALGSELTHAAGGHHAVDDAAILEVGQCQVESWVDRTRGGDPSVLHIGPACRVGPVELGLNFDHARSANDHTTSAGVQVKWAEQVRDGLGIGAVLALTATDARPRRSVATIVVPVTCTA